MSKSILEPEQLAEVRAQVRDLLGRTQAFRALAPAQRSKLAGDMVQVLSYLADPTAGQGGDAVPADNAELMRLVAGQAKNKPSVSNKPSAKTAGDLLNASGAQQAGDSFEQLTGAVDFPGFVSGLVEGVFTSIVDSSIRQMQEYGKLLEAVVKSVNEFKNEHITPQDARQSVLDRFPGIFDMKDGEDGGRLGLKDGVDEDAMPSLQDAFGVDGEVDLSDEESEQKLVESVRLQMARQRQQQLATMVLLGINRIIVTDGHINAKVFIDVRSFDRVERDNYASESDFDAERDVSKKRSWLGSDRGSNVKTRVTSAYAQSKDKSESEIKTRANLSGEVRINFRSETFPLERIGSPAELTALNTKAAKP